MTSRSSGNIYEETLAVFDRNENRYEPLTTPEVATALDANRRTVYKRLRTLVDHGELETEETGSNSRVWWRPPVDGPDSPPTQLDTVREVNRSGEWHETLFEQAPDGIVVHDADGSILDANETFAEMIGYSREALRSMDVTDVEVGIDEETLRNHWRSMDAGSMQRAEVEGTHRRADGSTYQADVWAVKVSLDERERDRFVAFVRDVTERKKRERELEHYETLARTASDVIVRIGANGVVQDANPAVAEVFGYEPDELVGESITTLMPDRLADQHQTAVERYLRTGERRLDWEYVELPGVRADGTEIPLGISFSDYEHGGQRYFTGIIRDITQRKERERELERQREQLEALNRLNDVVHEVTEAVIDQSTRREIEQAVCDRLADSQSYRFAWICAVDSSSNSVEPRTEAGIDGFLEDVPLSTDPEDPTGSGPSGTAAVTGEMQIVRDIRENAEYEPWCEHAREYGYRSAASIPIVHEGTLYGILGLASERPDAFAAEEREVVGRIGEVVGHAIAAVERKRALLSDEVVELAFRMHDVEELGLPGSENGRIVLDRILPLDEETYLTYGTATGDVMDTVRALVDAERTPYTGPVNVIETNGDETRFELRLADPPFLPAVVDAGGYIHEARIEGGKYVIRIHLPPSADVRRIVDAVTDAYPATEMVTQRQTGRATPSPHQIVRALGERLTERQRVTLEAAFAMGFFEWPRSSSGEDVADSLEISPSTFHQHLRKSQEMLLDVLFEETHR